MPTTESDQPVVVEEEQEPRVPLAHCYECGRDIFEGEDHMSWASTTWGNSRERHRACRSCTIDFVEAVTFYCELCEEDHINGYQTSRYNIAFDGDWDDWVEYLHIRTEYMRSTDSIMFCEAESPCCAECGDLAELPDDWDGYDTGDTFYCRYCLDHGMNSAYIHEWSYVPPLVFRDVQGDDVITTFSPHPKVPYLGMELEMENATHLADSIVESYFSQEYVWLKRDGSLSEEGVELVTHPATFDWYMKHFPFDNLGEIAKGGGESFHPGNCGIHIHISSDAFSEAHLFKFLSFHYENPVICQTIGQRGSADYCSWSGWMETRPNLVKFAKKDPSSRPHHRYVAVNLTEEATVELRYFRGNLNPDRVKKNLEWVDGLYRYTKQLSAKDVREGKLSFPHLLDWMEQQGDRYATVLAFIQERQINLLGEATAQVNRSVEV